MRTGAGGAGRVGAVPAWLLGGSVLLSPCLEHAPGALLAAARSRAAPLCRVSPSNAPILPRALVLA